MAVKYYSFHGVRFKLDGELGSPLKTFERIFDVSPLKSRPEKINIALEFSQIDESPKLKITAPLRSSRVNIKLNRKNNISGYYENNCLLFSDSKSVVEINYKSKKAAFKLHPGTLKAGKLFSHTILPLVVSELMRSFGFHYIHASCAEIKGKAILFMGPAASGKTTACYSLLREGANFVSDDAVLLKRYKNNFKVHSFIKEFGIQTGIEALFKELKKIKCNVNEKTDIHSTELLNSRFKRRSKPQLLIYTGYDIDGKTPKLSKLIGKIIKENEFSILNKRDLNNMLTDMSYFFKNISVGFLEDRSLVLDSAEFFTFIHETLALT